MAIAFDQERACSHIYTYDKGTDTYSSNLNATSAFDYFPDDAAVDDAIYFLYYGDVKWNDIKLFVGTAFAATSVTFIWEYYDYPAQDWVTLTVVDNTNGFTTLGENWVTFDPPTDWIPFYYCLINGSRGKWIRCRISAIDTPTEGGAQSTQTVTIKDWAIEVTGYTEETPCTFDDIYDADVAGSWGVVHKVGNCYKIDVRLLIGDGSTATYLATENEAVEFIANSVWTCYLQLQAYLRMGKLDTNSVATLGSTFIFNDYQCTSAFYANVTGATFKFYDSQVYMIGNKLANGPVYWRCATLDIKDSKVVYESAQRFVIYTDATIDGLKLYNNTFITNQSPTTPWKNIKFIGLTSNAFHPHFGSPVTLENVIIGDERSRSFNNYHATCNLVNPTLNWDEITLTAIHSDDYWYVKFTLDVHVSDYNTGNNISGATVTLYDTDGAEVFSTTTDSNGEITQQEITYRYIYYNNVTKTYSPHKLIVKKAGYQTEQDIFDMDEKKSLQISLQKAKDIVFVDGQPALNLSASDPESELFKRL